MITPSTWGMITAVSRDFRVETYSVVSLTEINFAVSTFTGMPCGPWGCAPWRSLHYKPSSTLPGQKLQPSPPAALIRPMANTPSVSGSFFTDTPMNARPACRAEEQSSALQVELYSQELNRCQAVKLDSKPSIGWINQRGPNPESVPEWSAEVNV